MTKYNLKYLAHEEGREVMEILKEVLTYAVLLAVIAMAFRTIIKP